MSQRVLFLGHGAERTGPPLLMADLVAGLAELGWDAQVLVARDGPLLRRYRESGATARAVHRDAEPMSATCALARRLGLPAVADRIRRGAFRLAAARVGPVDLVYVNAATPPTADLLAALRPGPDLPVVVHVHELNVGLRGNLTAEQRSLLLERADLVIAVSEPVAELLRSGHGVDPERLVVCEGFIDARSVVAGDRNRLRAQLGIPASAPVVGSVGLPDWRKDPEHLLRAVARLGEDIWIVWVGGDPESTDGRHLADEAVRLGLSGRFVHIAHRPDATVLLGAFDVFALPAREDALPLAAMEAAAAGLPLVCFRTGGIARLCDEGAGRAVRYPDTAAFADALQELISDPQGSGERGRELVRERHDVAVGVARIDAAIRPLLEQRTA